MVKTVLIVDDDPAVRYTVKHALEALDKEYKVIEAENGTQCFSLLEKQGVPDVILLDIMMPGMNGWEVQRQLKENIAWKVIPVVFLTAVGDATSKKIGSITGKDCIEKPFKTLELKKRLDAILSH